VDLDAEVRSWLSVSIKIAQGTAQLPGHQRWFCSDQPTGESQHHSPVKYHLVLPELIRVPALRAEVNRAVYLSRDYAPVRKAPFGIEVSTASRFVHSHRLPGRLRKLKPMAEPPEVDLAQGVRTAPDVRQRP
jgi:hypothetical protein